MHAGQRETLFILRTIQATVQRAFHPSESSSSQLIVATHSGAEVKRRPNVKQVLWSTNVTILHMSIIMQPPSGAVKTKKATSHHTCLISLLPSFTPFTTVRFYCSGCARPGYLVFHISRGSKTPAFSRHSQQALHRHAASWSSTVSTSPSLLIQCRQ